MHEPAQTPDPEPAGIGPGGLRGGPGLPGAGDRACALDAELPTKALDRSRFESIWWKQFDDPVLNQLVQASLEGNRDLRVAFARLKSARSIREDAENDQLPVVTSRVSSDIGKGQIPGQTEQRVNSERYDLGLDMAWELDLFGRIQRQIEASQAQEEAAAADLQQLQVSLIAELVDAYGQLRGAQLREKIALANLKTQQESRSITETLRDAGVGNDRTWFAPMPAWPRWKRPCHSCRPNKCAPATASPPCLASVRMR